MSEYKPIKIILVKEGQFESLQRYLFNRGATWNNGDTAVMTLYESDIREDVAVYLSRRENNLYLTYSAVHYYYEKYGKSDIPVLDLRNL